MSKTSGTVVYVSYSGSESAALRNDLCSVLKSAGMQVLPENPATADEAEIRRNISQSSCAILTLFSEATTIYADGRETLLSEFQYGEALKKMEADAAYKLVIWLPPSTDLLTMPQAQLLFMNKVRNSISGNMVFNTAQSSLELVDDIRSLVEVMERPVFDIKETEIFLVSNQLDDADAKEVIDMLMDIVPVENLSIVQDSDMDYSEYCSQQIGKSKLAVVYFKESADWALPFAQQVWKKIGGASSHVPILLIGDEDPDTNLNKKIKAPKVISLIVSGELIPLEIKVQYDKVTELLNK